MTRRTSVIPLIWLLASSVVTYGQTCGITNPAQPFSVLSITRATNSVTLAWKPTCTNYAFGVFSTDQPLTTNSQYQSRAGMWGSLSGTSAWTDFGVTNRQRFYKILRIEPTPTSDWNGDGLPDEWDLQYGLNPFDPSVATNDFDGDGYSNYDEFLMGTDPTSTNDPITVYVDAANTNGVYDGSQANPFNSIQDAIESSVDVNSNLAIRVRPGSYYEPVSNLQYDPYSGDLVSTRLFLFIYAANQDWSLSTDPGSHVIDSLGFQHRDLLLFSSAPPAPAVEFNGVTRARINGFTIRGGQGVYGGGVYASPTNNGPIYISNCIIEKNGGSDTEAGGIYIQAGTNSMIYNTAVARNVGEVGGIYDVNGIRIWNCTIVSNTTLDATFGAVTGGSGAPNIRNSIIWSNGFDAIDLYFANADYSTFGSNEFVTAGLHNLSIDPMLVNILFGNYRLQANSPVIGEGVSLPIEQRDLYGNPRPVTGRFDIGANEYTDSLGDGIQDDWKIKYGLSLTVSQATQDPDGDGLNNLQEYNNNSNPNNPDTDGDGISDGPLVPTGSGLQPGPDPDPTTPDLVLNTVFWDYFFEDTFLMYVDGNPQWINLPPTSPRPVVLNGYHIGNHVTFQWQVLDDPSGEPYLVFYVPQTTSGNIIPDVDATPINEIQFGFGDYAPPDGPWGFTLAQTTPMNAEVCAGFDSETPLLTRGALPALSVPQGGTNTLTVAINPASVVGQILFQTTNSTTATASPSSASSATQLVTVAGLATGNSITTNQLIVLGYGAQNTFTTTCSKVNIDILPQRTNITVALYSVSIKSSTGFVYPGPTNVPSNTELQSYLASLYGTQANVSFTVLPVTNVAVMYDTNENFKLDWNLNSFAGETETIYDAAHTSGTNVLNVYYVNALTNANVIQQAEGVTYYLTFHASFIQDTHPSSSVNLTAHELGHSLANLPNTGGLGTSAGGVPGFPDQLMWYQDETNNPCRLIQREWEGLNSAAQRPLP
ncbi:MAG TPA: right-handed parallel beta-helix repeat-containing protein [Verrucomicrobiae bacterium]|nr:right-handed parallel beta-helix repeat-containing protein [Verrucomicrobiae bacterium]